jgi:hypothetical protein
MKNEITYKMEQSSLAQMIQDQRLEEADTMCTRMLKDYN